MMNVDRTACDACGTCVGVCPSDALVLEETITVDSGLCTGCGICAQICPFGALSIGAAEKESAS
jgi:ferredoxin